MLPATLGPRQWALKPEVCVEKAYLRCYYLESELNLGRSLE
jgi:hypothetical protein